MNLIKEVMLMENNFVGAFLAFAAGAVISFGNFKLSELFLSRCREKFASVSLIRQLVQVAYVLMLFFCAEYIPWDRTYLLTGGVLGVTVPMLFFTIKLLKQNNALAQQEKKEDDNNG